MKHIIVAILRLILQNVNRTLVCIGIVKPKVIIYMDGGICSQMHMYVQGQYYKNKHFDIYYDIDWFIRCGKDMDGIFERKLELQEMFPYIEFRTIDGWKSKYYRTYYRYNVKGGELPAPEKINRTTYFYGYFSVNSTDFDALFNSCFSKSNRCIVPKGGLNNFNKKCAVHVRRGDLANREFDIYKRPRDNYFVDAINYVNKNFAHVFYFLFSDEPDWVEKYVCPYIDVSYQIMKNNKAYEDLLLIAECDVIIASQGSFGYFGARLNKDSILITPESLYENLSISNNL